MKPNLKRRHESFVNRRGISCFTGIQLKGTGSVHFRCQHEEDGESTGSTIHLPYRSPAPIRERERWPSRPAKAGAMRDRNGSFFERTTSCLLRHARPRPTSISHIG